ncbi:glycoside hydrolase domain-containing protein [Streptomyces sp. TLI_171]|uniref:glycoside hydrolase domain-containing protein n=1 Tax=Streptomyces sp. TLI_171 TaxID=1938859 RepID=UPI000C4BCC38|nr:glycoside hydrolase domain-containing protein [Streptomyces sp. TLI_171]RKE21063.1 D-mannose binding lectin [Streptomyces sp. TLI_171]
MQRRTAGRATVVILAASGLAATVPSAWGAGTTPTVPGPTATPAPSAPDVRPEPSASAGADSAAPAAQPSAAAAAGATKRVDYRGFHAQVPADWPVVDLAAAPTTCVRLDVSAVYLGTPGDDQNCPAHLAPGRADGLLIQPVKAGRAQGTVQPGRPIAQSVLDDADAGHQIQARLGSTGLEVTASYAAAPDRVRQILETATADAATGARVAAAAPAVTTATYAATTSGPRTDVVGFAFDACSAPSDAAMNAWSTSSPYRAVGVYIGGPSQACPAPVKSWVDSRVKEGWGFLPIYVGHQAARGNLLVDADLATARQQGADAADDAILKAAGLGFQPGAVLYNDMENYDSAVYRDRVVAYLAGWTERLHAQGWRSGIYASANSGVKDLAARYTDASYPQPDVLWSAAWNSHHDVTDAGMGLPAGAGYFTGGRRAHQYSGDVSESYGGYRIGIDANYLDVTSPGSDGYLQPGQRLTAGQSLSSDSITLTMQADGNLVAYLKVAGAGQPLWSTNTWGQPGAYAVMQDDGNLVVYSRDGGPGAGGALWSSNTWGGGNGGSYTVVQADGNVVIYRRGGGPAVGGAIWATGTQAGPSAFGGGRRFTAGQWTQSATTRLVMQADGNLVLYRRSDGAALWSSNTWGHAGAYALMQADGNLVVYRAGRSDPGGALWSTGTWGNAGAYAVLQDDANFVVYRKNGGPAVGGAVWASNTWGRG